MTRITTPVGKFCFVNMHTTAGGGSDPEAGDVDTVRQSELDEAVQLCTQAASDGYVSAIVGDLNCGPEASAGNYEHLKTVGFTDMLARFDVGYTWDQASPLNNLPVFKGCPSQRIDHLFLKSDAPIEATSASKCFTESCVRVAKGEMVTLSDHYGFQAVLRRQ